MNLKTNIINEQRVYPKNPVYFKEIEFSNFLELNENYKYIESVNSIKIWAEVESAEVVKTEKGISNEGQKLTGTEISVVLKISEKITYSGKFKNEPVQVVYNEMYKSLFIPVPEELKKLDIKALLRANRVVIAPYVETVYARKFDDRKIYKAASIFVEARIC